MMHDRRVDIIHSPILLLFLFLCFNSMEFRMEDLADSSIAGSAIAASFLSAESCLWPRMIGPDCSQRGGQIGGRVSDQ